MVKLKGPMLGSRASGSLADTVTFAKQKGTHYARKHAAPTNPQSGLQVSMRAMMTFLSQQWKNLTTGNQATWSTAFPTEEIPNYNAFLKYNLERWRNSKGPSKRYPATEEGNYIDSLGGWAAGYVRHAIVTMQPEFDIGDNWAIFIFHKQNGPFDAAIDNLVHIELAEELKTFKWTHTPLAAGEHSYLWYPATNDGKMTFAQGAESWATVT